MHQPLTHRGSFYRVQAGFGLLVLLVGSSLPTFGQNPGGAPSGVNRSGPPVQSTMDGSTGPAASTPNAPPSPEEYGAYVSALNKPAGRAQAAALQTFLEAYPQGSLAPQARQSLALARTLGGKPPAGTLASSPVPISPNSSPQPPRQSSPRQSFPQSASQTWRRAVINLQPHSLMIRADNSSLSQILRDLSASSGMNVEGLAHDEHIYGNFGPGEPRDVIASLVGGLGYNVMMVGETSRGGPRRLVLSPRAQGAGTSAATSPLQGGEPEQDDEMVQDDQPAVPELEPTPGRPFTPVTPSAPGPGPNGRTTQQMLEELRRLHQPAEGQPPDQPQ